MNHLAQFDPREDVIRAAMFILAQTSLAIILAAVLSRTLLHRRAADRHGLWLVVLAWLFLSPAVVFMKAYRAPASWAVRIPLPDPLASVSRDEGIGSNQLETAATPSRSLPASFELSESIWPPQSDSSAQPGPRESRGPRTSPVPVREVTQGGSALRGALAVVWVLGVVVGLGRLAWGWRQVQRLARSERPFDSANYVEIIAVVRESLGGLRMPAVMTSPLAVGPMAIGLLRPRIVLPDGLADRITADEFRDVLIHECGHVIRRDPWVGLPQRLAGSVFWPNPLVHYLNAKLSRAREEVCDNYVLRRGDRSGYARTILSLTETYRPFGAIHPELGLIGARWTLADRIAGLLDPERTTMTKTSTPIKFSLAAVLATSMLIVAFVRIDTSARADGPKDERAAATAGVWSIAGTVVDEQGKPVAKAVVRSADRNEPARAASADDGTFTLHLGGGQPTNPGLIAEIEGEKRIGVIRFDPPRYFAENGSVRIVLKPSRRIAVTVRDAAKKPVADAAVAAVSASFESHATTGPNGVAMLEVAADAQIPRVIGLKPGVGFDYFENYTARPVLDVPPLPDAVALTLDGATTFTIKAVDLQGRPIPNVVFTPYVMRLRSKIQSVNLTDCPIADVKTDANGVASLSWVPKETRSIRCDLRQNEQYGCPTAPILHQPSPETTVTLLRKTRVGGTVRFVGGDPAAGVLIELQGPNLVRLVARSANDGRYVFNAPSGVHCVLAVRDGDWSAPSKMLVLVSEGKAQNGLDFTLDKGTVVHGRITEGPGGKPAANTRFSIVEFGPQLSSEVMTAGDGTARTFRQFFVTTDADGRYRFRVNRGHYRLDLPRPGGSVAEFVKVRNEAEIVRNFVLKGSAKPESIAGVVVEKTADGVRPVPRASIANLPIGRRGTGALITADDQGRFQFARFPGPQVLLVRSLDKSRTAFIPGPEGSLAGFVPVPENAASPFTVVIAKAGRISGRVVDGNGKPQPSIGVGFDLASGSDYAKSAHFTAAHLLDEQGRFTMSVPVGTHGELTAAHRRNGKPTGAVTMLRFQVEDAEPVTLTDLIVPADKEMEIGPLTAPEKPGSK